MKSEIIQLDIAIIGGGAAGLACAIKLHDMGIKNCMLFERNPQLGGILRQCVHPGFGLSYFKEDLTGPQYAGRLMSMFNKRGINYMLNSMVTDISGDKELTVFSAGKGVIKYQAKAIVFAVGCRERTRENLEIPGMRPMGVFTAGQAQTMINIYGMKIGHKVIIQGSGDIGLIMARRLKIEGYDVIAVLESLPYLAGLMRNKVQCLDHFGIPLMLSSKITEISGKKRVAGVSVETPKGIEHFECDTVLFAVGLIPELELALKLGLTINPNFTPTVNSGFEGTMNGVFFCGNCLHINDLADNASMEGEMSALFAVSYLKDSEEFRRKIQDCLPYREGVKNQKYNSEFFANAGDEKGTVCIVCPKSCLITHDSNPCQRGRMYLKSIVSGGFSQRLTTTVWNSHQELVPFISRETIPIEQFPEKVREIKKCSSSISDS